MRILAPGWFLYQDQWVMCYVSGPMSSGQWLDAALIDRVTGAVYPLLPGITRETVERVLGRGALDAASTTQGDYRRAAGIAPRRAGEPLPEDVIRALRDGEE